MYIESHRPNKLSNHLKSFLRNFLIFFDLNFIFILNPIFIWDLLYMYSFIECKKTEKIKCTYMRMIDERKIRGIVM